MMSTYFRIMAPKLAWQQQSFTAWRIEIWVGLSITTICFNLLINYTMCLYG